MTKQKVSYVCQECGYDTPAYLGKCPECGSWQSFKEVKPSPILDTQSKRIYTTKPLALKEIKSEEKSRLSTGFSEFDTVLGGGIVQGAVMLLAGDPGVGKSTLLLELALTASSGKSVLYVSGEESEEQIKLRADRLAKTFLKNKSQGENLKILSATDVDGIVSVIENDKPDLVVIDSIQTMQSQNAGGLSGSVGQVRYCALALITAAKTLKIPVMIVGHVTKEGTVAGPMVLSHMVDTVLFLEGEKFTKLRLLRSFKNRFGPVDEVGVFLMEEEGMNEVTTPEQLFLGQERENVPGSVIASTLEGSRAFLVELQALVVPTKFSLPRRVVSGVDLRRVELLMAVLLKHSRLPLDSADVFVNVAGGLKLSDPALDLGVCLAVWASVKNIPLSNIVAVGEVGLLGELRSVPGLEKRVKEAKKMGFKKVITPTTHKSLQDVLKSFER